MNRAGFLVRTVAAVIDGLALVALYFLVRTLFKPSLDSLDWSSADALIASLDSARRRVFLISFLVGLAYAATEIFLAASPGKIVMGLKIVGEDGQDLSPVELTKRWALKWSASLVGVVWALTGVGAIQWVQGLVGLAVFAGCVLALGATRQAAHDLIAKTAVRRTSPGLLPVTLQEKLRLNEREAPGFPVIPATAAPAAATPPPPPAQPA